MDDEQLISGRDFMRRETAHDEPGWVVLQADAGTAEAPDVPANAHAAHAAYAAALDVARSKPAATPAVAATSRGRRAAGISLLAGLVLGARAMVLRGRGQLAAVVRGRGLPVVLGAGLVATALVAGALLVLVDGGGRSEPVPTSAQTPATAGTSSATPPPVSAPTPTRASQPSATSSAVPAEDKPTPVRKPREPQPRPPVRATVKVAGGADRVRVSIKSTARGRVRWQLLDQRERVVDSRLFRMGTIARMQFVVKELRKGRYTWRVTPLGGGPVRAGRVTVKTPPPPPAPEPVTPVVPVPDPTPEPEPEYVPEPEYQPEPDPEPEPEPSPTPTPTPAPTPAPDPSDLPDPVES